MSSDSFQIAAEGWEILTSNRVAREGARHLLVFLADALDASVAGIRFVEDLTSYGWVERVDRHVPEPGIPVHRSPAWKHPFPDGTSWWFFENTRLPDAQTYNLLNLLAGQWLHLRNTFDTPHFDDARLPGRKDSSRSNPAWVAVSRASRIILSRVPILCHSTRPVLIIGENGSGRTHLARMIHRSGPDPSTPFFRLGTDTDETATGTLYIPAWTSHDRKKQSDLLTDPRRIIAAAVPDPGGPALRPEWNLITRGEGSILTIPALRDRKDDIPLLAGLFLDQLTSGTGISAPELSSTAIEALRAYSWPGNVRELKETLRLCVSGSWKNRISVGDLPPAIRGALHYTLEPSFPERLVALEYEVLKEELGRQRGNMTRTARALGLTPRQVSWRIRKYGIDTGDFKKHREVRHQEG